MHSMTRTPDPCLPQPEKRTLDILVADDHAIIRIGLKVIIKNILGDVHIDEAIDGESVIRKLKSEPFDLLILDINMPRTEPFSLTNYLLNEFHMLKLLIFTVNQELNFAKRFLQMGVHGYVSKQSKQEELGWAIQKILAGQTYISEHLSEIISNELVSPKNDNPFMDLSDREFEVVLQILKGYSVNEIATTLHLNRSTVGTHKSRILKKLGLSNIMDLHSLAKRHNVL